MIIERIDDVLPHVDGRKDFVVAKREGYTVIDYTFAGLDTFDHPIRVECRGLKFAPDGRLIARPLAKFFNIGERESTQPHAIDFGQSHWILPKLDGSMIHPCMVDGTLRLMTRMGWTDTARKCETRHLHNVAEFCTEALANGVTPIFEWIAPDNQIVIKYPESKLVLLAMRNTVDGTYLEPATVRVNALRNGLDVIEALPPWHGSAHAFLSHVAPIKGEEGFIVRFASGLWLKAKAEDYVIKHKAKDSIVLEKNVIRVSLTNGVDDVLPLLAQDEANELRAYHSAIWDGMHRTATEIDRIVSAGAGLDQKSFAVEHLKDVAKDHRAMAFRVRKGEPAIEVVKDFILSATGSQTDVDRVRHLHRATWAAGAVTAE